MKSVRRFSVVVCGQRMIIRCSKETANSNNLYVGKRIKLTDFYLHEDDLRVISKINPYSLIRSLLSTYKKEYERHNGNSCHAEQHMRKELAGIYNTQKQVAAKQAYSTVVALLNSCPDTNLKAKDTNKESKRHHLAHPKVISIKSLIYIMTEWKKLYQDENMPYWLPQSIYLDKDSFVIYNGPDQTDLIPTERIKIVDWLQAWINFLCQPVMILYGADVNITHKEDFEQLFLSKFYYDIDAHDGPSLPLVPITSGQVTEPEIIEAVVTEEVSKMEPANLSDDEIFPKANGDTIVVQEPNTTDKMLSNCHPKLQMHRLKFPIRARATFLRWAFELRAERPELEDYCKVVARIINRQYPDIKIEFKVESTSTVAICVRDYDLEDSYPLVDPTIDVDAELEKPINKLTDNRLFRRIRALEMIIDKCHMLFYELVRHEYLLSKI